MSNELSLDFKEITKDHLKAYAQHNDPWDVLLAYCGLGNIPEVKDNALSKLRNDWTYERIELGSNALNILSKKQHMTRIEEQSEKIWAQHFFKVAADRIQQHLTEIEHNLLPEQTSGYNHE